MRNSSLHPEFQQEAVARGFEREYEVFGTPESYFQQLPAMLHHKKNKLASLLESVGLKPIMPEGGYFMTADFSSISERSINICIHQCMTENTLCFHIVVFLSQLPSFDRGRL